MQIDRLGWDIGGAHLKAAAMFQGQLVAVFQEPCPLWLGLEHFHLAAQLILARCKPSTDCIHAVTMTGELVDSFPNREVGVLGLVAALGQHVDLNLAYVFAGPLGFIPAAVVRVEQVPAIASANWLATAYWAAQKTGSGLLVDIGSTTTDFMLFDQGQVLTKGYSDYERMREEELVYTGVVRTSLMVLAEKAPFEGDWIGLMAEHFATAADVYRLTGELPEHGDQSATADGAEKSQLDSARRVARLLGRDVESASAEAWRQLAFYFREQQLKLLQQASYRHLSRGLLAADSPLIGAGIGRFLVQELASRLQRPFLDFAQLFPAHSPVQGFTLADCAPAVAVACLMQNAHA